MFVKYWITEDKICWIYLLLDNEDSVNYLIERLTLILKDDQDILHLFNKQIIACQAKLNNTAIEICSNVEYSEYNYEPGYYRSFSRYAQRKLISLVSNNINMIFEKLKTKYNSIKIDMANIIIILKSYDEMPQQVTKASQKCVGHTLYDRLIRGNILENKDIKCKDVFELIRNAIKENHNIRTAFLVFD